MKTSKLTDNDLNLTLFILDTSKNSFGDQIIQATFIDDLRGLYYFYETVNCEGEHEPNPRTKKYVEHLRKCASYSKPFIKLK